jgi:hypothetical protein
MAGKRRARAEQPTEPMAQPTEPMAQPDAAPPSGGLSPEAMEQLKSLAQLHDQGILTDQEFDQQKAKVLGG